MKKKGKPKLTAKEKKERSFMIDKVISVLPLEFRGNDPNLRRNMETVIEGLLDKEGKGAARTSFDYLVQSDELGHSCGTPT